LTVGFTIFGGPIDVPTLLSWSERRLYPNDLPGADALGFGDAQLKSIAGEVAAEDCRQLTTRHGIDGGLQFVGEG
jgi:hypothetical protein